MTPFDSFWNAHIKDSIPLITALIGALGGGLVSGFLVHLLTQSRDREKWILDCKKQEYRELLDALSESYSTALSLEPRDPFTVSTLSHHEKRLLTLQGPTVRVFTDRIFIVKDLDLKLLKKRWGTALLSYSHSTDVTSLAIKYNAIHDEIVKAANRAVPKTTLQRLMFWRN